MNVKTKSVYYCDHCKRHGLSRNAMERHERGCTMNPDRSCRWCEEVEPDHPGPGVLAAEIRARAGDSPTVNPEIVEWLRARVGGCPVCMLAAFRQSGLDYHWFKTERVWDYEEEVSRWREQEKREEARGW